MARILIDDWPDGPARIYSIKRVEQEPGGDEEPRGTSSWGPSLPPPVIPTSIP